MYKNLLSPNPVTLPNLHFRCFNLRTFVRETFMRKKETDRERKKEIKTMTDDENIGTHFERKYSETITAV